MNDILQWVTIAAIAFLVLGLFRQISVLLPSENRSLTQSGPPLGDPVPRRLQLEMERALQGPLPRSGLLIAFVTESCIACQTLLGQLQESRALQDGQRLLLVAKNASEPFREALDQLGLPIVHDNGELWEACRVTNTPLLVKVSDDARVSAKGVTHHVDTVALAA